MVSGGACGVEWLEIVFIIWTVNSLKGKSSFIHLQILIKYLLYGRHYINKIKQTEMKKKYLSAWSVHSS